MYICHQSMCLCVYILSSRFECSCLLHMHALDPPRMLLSHGAAFVYVGNKSMYFASLPMQKSEPVPLMFTLHYGYVHVDILANSRPPERRSWYASSLVTPLDARLDMNHIHLAPAFLKRMRAS